MTTRQQQAEILGSLCGVIRQARAEGFVSTPILTSQVFIDALEAGAALLRGEIAPVKDQDTGTSLTADAAVSSVAQSQLSHDVRDRVIRAGVGWCAFSHSHDNSKAALAAAIEGLAKTVEHSRLLAQLQLLITAATDYTPEDRARTLSEPWAIAALLNAIAAVRADAHREAPTQQRTDSFWVVEQLENDQSKGYWNGGSSRSFVPDIDAAMQFCRRVDAQRAIAGWHWRDVRLTEHLYMAETKESEQVVDKKAVGLYGKFIVTRTDGTSAPGKKHEGCEYFVLDLDHDPHAYEAVRAYEASCRRDYPKLADDLASKRETKSFGGVVK